MEVMGAAELSPFIDGPRNYRLAAPEMPTSCATAGRLLIFEKQYSAVVDELTFATAGMDSLSASRRRAVLGLESSPFFRGVAGGTAAAAGLPITHHPIHERNHGSAQGAMLTHEGILALSESLAYELSQNSATKCCFACLYFT